MNMSEVGRGKKKDGFEGGEKGDEKTVEGLEGGRRGLKE